MSCDEEVVLSAFNPFLFVQKNNMMGTVSNP